MAKEKPGSITFASGGAGAGAHLSGELLKSMAKIDITHVPYKGNAPALNDTIGGQTSLMFDTVTTAMPYVRAGKLRALATTGPTRPPIASDVPTMAEAGLPGFEVSAWYMVFAPRKTPQDVIKKINAAINKALADPLLARDLGKQGVVLAGGSWPTPRSTCRSRWIGWGKIIKAAGIKAD